ncbi:type I-E CRISPR-associated protein Cse2/CasB [Streptomyces sp. PT12]|uniref:type I-E CRISPR-associated protein Cse2/CasB n=1 Tax=Streptomyces sp. PT12 TaxID=1510197 RepID=UPI000DE277CA|nr:type I-E CRISPR-associated protein Cse2/CasB [Streptomyces sp. PT12]RBM06841.1 type I-E CRISPR-associated protein Cse2/CasB [Streptomyces sp. PT12]
MTSTVPRQAKPAEPTSSPPPRRDSPRDSPLRTAVAAHIRGLYVGYQADRPQAVATLARLRRGLGRPLHTQPDLWGLIGMDAFQQAAEKASPPADTGYWSSDRTLDRVEAALHSTLTLWSLHQQAHRGVSMHARGWGLGRAVRELMRAEGTDELDERLRKRFVRTASATSFDVMTLRLRELVLLLRSAGLPLDYGLLADQLLRWQEPGGRGQVHRSWGRDFHLAGAQRRRAADPEGTDAPVAQGQPSPPDDRYPSAD